MQRSSIFSLAVVLLVVGCVPLIPVTAVPTLDNRATNSGCLSWKLLDIADYGKTLCVYGYPGPPLWQNVGEIGPYLETEFFTDPYWFNYGSDWRVEGRSYIVHTFVNGLERRTPSEFYAKFSLDYPLLMPETSPTCVGITGRYTKL